MNKTTRDILEKAGIVFFGFAVLTNGANLANILANDCGTASIPSIPVLSDITPVRHPIMGWRNHTEIRNHEVKYCSAPTYG